MSLEEIQGQNDPSTKWIHPEDQNTLNRIREKLPSYKTAKFCRWNIALSCETELGVGIMIASRRFLAMSMEKSQLF